MAKREAVLSVIVDAWGGMHPGAWRDPNAPADPAMDLERIKGMVQTAERGKFHCFFLADSLAQAMEKDPAVLALTSNAARYEPFTLLSALAMVTDRIGLALTASTTYSEPFNIARMFASLDHLSGGRAAWNVVTSTGEAAPNFNNHVLEREERYERASEFYDVVSGLWDSLEDDAFRRDKDSGLFFEPGKLHSLNHVGKYFSVEGPLNISRPPQGHPVIAQAGSSTSGLAFAVRVAELLFTYGLELDAAKELYAKVKGMAADEGRNPDDVKVLPSLGIVVGSTQAEADAKLARIDALADPRIGIERLKGLIDYDLTPHDLDGPVPDVPETESWSKTMQDYYLGMAREQNLTVRELALVAMRFDAVAMSADRVADHIEEHVTGNAADGFNVSFADANGSLEIFVDEVVPKLQARGLFHKDYRGATLRENLGLSRPQNRFV
ncbi:LLM class flavin-dependent oxidoreductase [Nocardioides sp. NPDC127503]|uniref:LLM class flavin-dependent oxidoreductase n=1 Tax=Nocardioides sp. NPDC127503 TaxID=3154516 RepID=UPI00332BFAA1